MSQRAFRGHAYEGKPNRIEFLVKDIREKEKDKWVALFEEMARFKK